MSRLDFSLRENALSRALSQRREPYVDLTISNPTAVALPIFRGELPAASSYAPDPRGLLSAREAVARYHGVGAEQVILTASTSEAYSWLFKLLCDPGDEVLVPQPSYPLFEFLTALESVKAIPYELRWDGEWHLETLPVSPKTRAILVVNPGNPTGAFLKRDELQKLLSLGLPIISDEVFADYVVEEDPRRVRTLAGMPGTFVLSGLSKVAGLPQLKLGWIVATAFLRELELIADTYLSVSTPVQLAAPRLLESRHEFQRALNSRLAENRRALRVEGAPWHALRSEGGWSAILSVPRSRPEDEWALALLDAGVLVHPGYFFDFPSDGFLVVSLLPEPLEFARGVATLRSVLG